jgi:hypothetical protein
MKEPVSTGIASVLVDSTGARILNSTRLDITEEQGAPTNSGVLQGSSVLM